MSAFWYPDEYLRTALVAARTIAVVGVSVKPERPSHFVSHYLHQHGYTIIPVNPTHAGQSMFDSVVYPSLDQIPDDVGEVHMVDIFRRTEGVLAAVDSALQHLVPRGLQTIWMQIGVINEEAAAKAEAANLRVVMDHCAKVEHMRLIGGRG